MSKVKTLYVIIPAVRDSINIKENFPTTWMHQAFLPLPEGKVIEYLISNLIAGYSSKERSFSLEVVILTSEKFKDKFKEHLDLEKNNRKIKIKIKCISEYTTGFLHTISLAFGNISCVESSAIMIHYWDTILSEQVYQKAFDKVEDLDPEKPQIIVLVHSESGSFTDTDSEEYELVDVLPRATFSYSVYEVDKKFEGLLRFPRWDYIILRENNGKNNVPLILVQMGIGTGKFYKMTQSLTNINLTSEYRVPEIIKYIVSTSKNSVDMQFVSLNRGEFLTVKYPWEYLRTFDYLLRRLFLKWLKNIIDNIENKEMTYKGNKGKLSLIAIDKNREKLLGNRELEILLKELKDKNSEEYELIKTVVSDPSTIKLDYSFEEYPIPPHRVDSKGEVIPIEKIFDILDISAVLIFPGEHGSTDNLEVLTEHGLSDNDISLVKFSGINIIEGKIKINPGTIVANSYVSNGAILGHNVVVTHSIIGENVHIYPNSIVPYSIIGKGVRIGADVVLARERLRGEIEKRYSVVHKFLAEKRMVLYSTKFSALVGEDSKLMINVLVHPGRRIGHHVTIFPKLNVFYNLPPFYKMVDENRFEFDNEEYQRYWREERHGY